MSTPTHEAHSLNVHSRNSRHQGATTATPARTLGRAASGVHDYARRMSFLTELDSQTWLNRYSAAEWLADPDAVSSVAGYATWLRRIDRALAQLGLNSDLDPSSVVPSLTVSDLNLASRVHLDLRDITLAAGGPRHAGSVIGLPQDGAVDPTLATGTLDAERALATHAAVVYTLITMAQDVAALAADVENLSLGHARTPLPQRFVQSCERLTTEHAAVRRELLAWGAQTTAANRDFAVSTARNLTERLSAGLVPVHGW